MTAPANTALAAVAREHHAAARKVLTEHQLAPDILAGALALLHEFDPVPPPTAERSDPDMPIRHQRPPATHRKGWRKPEGSVLVTRPTRWGNPHPVGEPCPVPACARATHNRDQAVDAFEDDLLAGTLTTRHGSRWRDPVGIADAQRDLAGLDVVCACALDEKCHGDVILKFANPTTRNRTSALNRQTA